MENLGLYQDIAQRTQGDIYVGVVGPVRTRKIHFYKKNLICKQVLPIIWWYLRKRKRVALGGGLFLPE